ncbi:related to ribonuclease P protein subunit p29 [Rhynchosporium agropyri]|uniref:Ribonuclease P protein subunit n=1 Tax=Rhynchosporium agropyri TaxID=914238 RepID=A0A1E1JT89_9HELO|nr:related to ribonuclease P protein subunit p29 [Rhynchosporium agropyri]
MSTQDIGRSLLARAFSPDTAGRIFTERVKTRPLHLKPTEPSTAQQQRRLVRKAKESRKKKQKPAPLSARQKRALCLYDIPKSQQKYAIYEPLHKMWVGYIQELLWEDGVMRQVTPSMATRLCSADFHGAELEVVRSRCVSRVGVKGIVVRDSRYVFEVVTKGDGVKILPKEHTVFRFTVPRPKKDGGDADGEAKDDGQVEGEKKVLEVPKDVIFELHGDQFEYRAADRANRKFKSHYLSDL